MNNQVLRIAFNAVYFAVAAACFAWFIYQYGVGLNVTIICLTAGVFNLCLLVASLKELFAGSFDAGLVGLSSDRRRALRAFALLLPLLALFYACAFYAIESTSCWPGGDDRRMLFNNLEEFLFGRAKCRFIIPKIVEEQVNVYMNEKFQALVKDNWHPPVNKGDYEIVCSCDVLRDGSIVNAKVKRSSNDKLCDEACLVALDDTAPPMPAGSPDRSFVEFTFNYRKHPEPAWIKELRVVPPYANELRQRGLLFQNHSTYPWAREHLLQCLKIRRSSLSASDPHLIEILLDLGELYSAMGLINESEKFLDEACAAAELGAPKNPDVLRTTLLTCAKIAYETQRFQKVVELYKKHQSMGGMPLDRCSRIRLAQSMYACRNYDAALSAFAAICKSDQSQDRARMSDAMIREEVALCKLYAERKPQQARRMIDSMLAEMEKHAGKHSNESKCLLLSELTEVYAMLGDDQAERKHLESALAEAIKSLGPLAPYTVAFRLELANKLWKLGKRQESLHLFERALSLSGANDSDRANALLHEGCFLLEHDLFIESERCLREALAIRHRLYTDEDYRTVHVQSALSMVLFRQGKLKEAEVVLPKSSSRNSAEHCGIAFELAQDYTYIGKVDKAIEILDSTIRAFDKRGAENNDNINECLSLYYEIISICRKHRADALLERYLKEQYQYQKKKGMEVTRQELIEFYIEHNQLNKAESICNLDIRELEHQWIHEQTAFQNENYARAHILLAQVKYLQHRKQSANFYLKRGIELLERYGRSELYVEAVGIQAQLHFAEGKWLIAANLLDRLLKRELSQCRQRIYGLDPVRGFASNVDSFSSGGMTYDSDDLSARYEPNMSQYLVGDSAWDYSENRRTRLPMIALAWPNECAPHSFNFLKAATLTTLSNIQERLHLSDICCQNRSLALDIIEMDAINPIPGCHFGGEPYERLLGLFSSARARSLSEKLGELRIKPTKSN